MDHKEKIRAALAHKSGKAPIDFGSSAVTGMHALAVAKTAGLLRAGKEAGQS